MRSLLLSSQLLYYLLIAQTGIVGVMGSDMTLLYPLPLGGIVGAIVSAFVPPSRMGLYGALIAQEIISAFYPHYSLEALFLFGLVMGYTTPLLLYHFGSESKRSLALGLALSYALGTALYGYPFADRGSLAVLLPLISLISLYLSPMRHDPSRTVAISWSMIGVLMSWIFVDSALFETLSRSQTMDIWSKHPILIILTHSLGVYLAYRYRFRPILIWPLFVLSYTLYYTHQGILLAMVYPIVISYYNVVLFSWLIEWHNIRVIALSMVLIGWVAASLASGVAVYHQLWIAVVALGMAPFLYLTRRIT